MVSQKVGIGLAQLFPGFPFTSQPKPGSLERNGSPTACVRATRNQEPAIPSAGFREAARFRLLVQAISCRLCCGESCQEESRAQTCSKART